MGRYILYTFYGLGCYVFFNNVIKHGQQERLDPDR